MADDSDGFISRWSKRKAQVRQGLPLDTAEAAEVPPLSADLPAVASEAPQEASAVEAPVPPPPTLAEAQRLSPTDDFRRFVARGVDPQVKNAALKTLFTDPHFNVMDGLDTYIGDYNTPDPLPPGMLRKMVQSQLLGLFDDEEQDEVEPLVPSEPSLTSDPSDPSEPAETIAHEDPDLQLQPDDGAGCPGAEPGAGPHAGRQH